MKHVNPIPEDIRNYLRYDPYTGTLTWLRNKGPRKVGDAAGNVVKGKHMKLKFRGHQYLYHRVAWFLHTGQQPAPLLDHRDLNGLNNRFRNLRETDRSGNSTNRAPYGSKPKGVGISTSGRYTSRITKDGKVYCLGTFDTAGEAHDAYARMAKELHGEFARTE